MQTNLSKETVFKQKRFQQDETLEKIISFVDTFSWQGGGLRGGWRQLHCPARYCPQCSQCPHPAAVTTITPNISLNTLISLFQTRIS